MFATEDSEPTKEIKKHINLVDLFKPNVGCTDLMYTETGDISTDLPLEEGINDEHHHMDVKDMNRELHSTINHNADIIPPNTLLPSVTNLFNRFRRDKDRMKGFDSGIDGTDVPQFAVCL